MTENTKNEKGRIKIRVHRPVWGTPITFLDKYCPTQFEIVDAREIALNDKQKNKTTCLIKDADSSINGKPTYARICIKKLS